MELRHQPGIFPGDHGSRGRKHARPRCTKYRCVVYPFGCQGGLFGASGTGGGIASYCVWGEGVDGLLPEADKVVFMAIGGGEPAALAGWDRVREAVGHLMEPTEHYPARYRVREFPDAAALAAIGVEEL